MSPPSLKTRERLSEVRYEIRGELARRARELEAQGRTLVKLNIGNPGAFGFRAPGHLQRAIADSIADTDPYTHQQGLPAAREAIAAFHKDRGTPNASPERVFIGNGVSELIDLSLRALLNPGDEVLLPSPDYPLWSASTILNDGRPVYYRCKVADDFLPDPDEIEALVSSRPRGKVRAIVLINPNNPTGATYPRELLERIVAIAARHDLLLMCDEIYDGILYDDAKFVPVAPIAGDVPCLSFGGLSKVHRVCGWRVGWAVLSGDRMRSGGSHRAHRRPGLPARPAAERRGDLRMHPLRRCEGQAGGADRRRRAVPVVRRTEQGAPRLRLARWLGGAVRGPDAQRRVPSRDGPARRAAAVRERAGAVRDRGRAARRRHHHRAVPARRPAGRGAERGGRTLRGQRAPPEIGRAHV